MNGINFDSLLDLEGEFYKESYNDALREGSEHTKKDGKLLGIQTGFQRFVIIGTLKRINDIFLTHIESNDKIDPERLQKNLKSLNEIQSKINAFYEERSQIIKSTNSPADVEFYESNLKFIRSKLKIIYLQLGYKSLYSQLESGCQNITGEINATHLENEGDMW